MAHHIEVVLTEDLPNVGGSGEVVRVKPGFARNFLIPRGLAAVATKRNVKQVEHARRVAHARAAKRRAAAEELAGKLKNLRVTIGAQAGEEEKLYGSITSRDVGEALLAKGIEIDRRKIVMDPIKELGSTNVMVKIAQGIDAEIEINVVPKE